MARYQLSRRADQDLFDIYIYGVQSFGFKQADAYITGMQERFEHIAAAPLSYPAVDSIRVGYRRCVYGVNTIYYRQEGDNVLIVRILRAQHVGKALSEDIS
ncbi:type II toxin-antitoxin system RelE/ParE family toxin [Rheinheimera nanhaiensis]|uniref:Toxin n=1 Tax=Rheinheimera nanhaiensis E407-8 TaxID=562729 RepID=I1E028_9GAMM|nr:type II toxin-antitoxin system RelE/ParE family toxin [Rheinheimera nanhaiensis]GAB59656.1 hypothetical protein RNAN_2662 [Rheinheimera nanhaiensis E407-8]